LTPAGFLLNAEKLASACHPEPQAKDLQLFFITSHSAISAYDQSMHEGSYCTYMMASRSRTLYVGVTGDLLKRVFQHKWKEHEGFTARYNCDRLIWFERLKTCKEPSLGRRN
jgi:hypothetical protein